MEAVVPVVLTGWVVLTVVLFWRGPGRDAALFALVGGWAFLPTGVYPPSLFAEPAGSGGSMHALAVPTALWLNKALANGLGCLLGVILFDWPAVRRLRFVWLDGPLVGWCLVPIVSALAGGQPLAQGLAQARYLVLAWGVPYLMGRLYLGDNESLRRLALALTLAGLLYVPLGLLEFLGGPFLYGLLYGPHPYQIEGADRFGGNRPVVFLEHGNQLGMWSATAAVAAVWLWSARQMPEIARLPGWVAASVLVAACVLFQSHGALIIALAVLTPLSLAGRRLHWLPRPAHAVLGAGVLLMVLAAATAVVGMQSGSWSGLRLKVRGVFHDIGKASFTWRLARYEESLPRILQRPVLGWAQPNWSVAGDGAFRDPVGLGFWLLALGMFGTVGLACWLALLVVPVAQVVRKVPASEWVRGRSSAIVLTAILLAMNTVDSLFNSVFLLPLLAGAGGINSWSAGIVRRR